MNDSIEASSTAAIVRLKGVITGYRSSRESANFVFTETDQTRFGVIAIAASLAGLSGQATSVVSNATAMEEEADHVSFHMDGATISGWLWRSPFKEGDFLEVAVQRRADHYELLGAVRPGDRTIALYPHCSRSRKTHILNAVKWWIFACLFLQLGLLAVSSTLESATILQFWSDILAEEAVIWFLAGVHGFIGIAIFSMARKWLPFAKVAETVFRALQLSNPGGIDLVKSSKGKLRHDDSYEFGVMYFRY